MSVRELLNSGYTSSVMSFYGVIAGVLPSSVYNGMKFLMFREEEAVKPTKG